MIKQIVDLIIETGCEQTTEGNWNFFLEEIAEKFNVSIDWLQENIDKILVEIESRNEVGMCDYVSDNSISVYYYIGYCYNIEKIEEMEEAI